MPQLEQSVLPLDLHGVVDDAFVDNLDGHRFTRLDRHCPLDLAIPPADNMQRTTDVSHPPSLT